jgi:hypothetical protein
MHTLTPWQYEFLTATVPMLTALAFWNSLFRPLERRRVSLWSMLVGMVAVALGTVRLRWQVRLKPHTRREPS